MITAESHTSLKELNTFGLCAKADKLYRIKSKDQLTTLYQAGVFQEKHLYTVIMTAVIQTYSRLSLLRTPIEQSDIQKVSVLKCIYISPTLHMIFLLYTEHYNYGIV